MSTFRTGQLDGVVAQFAVSAHAHALEEVDLEVLGRVGGRV